MTTAQELLDHVKDMKPSPNMERKPVKQAQPTAAQAPAPMCARIPPKRVELPALGGCVEILYDWEDV